MPRPSYRTSSLARVHVRVPSGKTVVRYRARKAGRAQCCVCGRELAGVPALRPSELRSLSKTSKRPERPYGGVLCPACLSRAIKEAVRASS
ncbi:MAG: 50S ribosomal protein L34e [Fervidicoccaceae archaeon]